MSEERNTVERDRQLILEASKKGMLAKLGVYTRLSGPGWLQSAITLGGGSLASSLYLGILAGFALLWLQPLAMVLGVVMLSAIGYVTLSTGERPFDAINKHVNPVLGWGWAIATLMANLVWALPQFSLGTASLRENLLPATFGAGAMDVGTSKIVIGVGILVICAVVVWFYDTGGKGIKLFEILLKVMVAIIILCFFGVVIKMSVSEIDGKRVLDWAAIGHGIKPDLRLLTSPAHTFTQYIDAVDAKFQGFWTSMIVSQQRDVMVSAAATAVGINMTFLLPYSMLKRGWDRDFRGLAIFDLSTGLFIPFILATGCVVIASASQFHTQSIPPFLAVEDAEGRLVEAPADMQAAFYAAGGKHLQEKLGPEEFAKLSADQIRAKVTALPEKDRREIAKRVKGDGSLTVQADKVKGMYNKIAFSRVEKEMGTEAFGKLSEDEKLVRIAALPEADRKMASMLVKRDAFALANSLKPLTGKGFSHYVFGIGVVGMAISSIIILMLINGFVVCEMLGRPSTGWLYRLGCLAPGITGFCAPFIWSGGKAQFWLAVPTSVFGFMLIPIAYITFALVMNSKKLLGEHIPKGGRRLVWNVLMLLAAGLVGLGSVWNVWNKTHWYGIAAIGAFIALALVVHFARQSKTPVA